MAWELGKGIKLLISECPLKATSLGLTFIQRKRNVAHCPTRRQTVRGSFTCTQFRPFFSPKTSAARCLPLQEIASTNTLLLSTSTTAYPSRLFDGKITIKDKKTPKHLAC
jgi:hypothetical protein